MSVIFKTLKKLRSQSSEEEKTGKLKRGRNVYSFRRILFSPSSMFLLIGLIFISGLAAIYGVSYIKDSLHEKRRMPVIEHAGIKTAPVPRDVKPEHIKPDNNAVPFDIPAPPDVIPVVETEPERPGFTVAPVERPVSEAPVYARYSPRKQNSITPEKSIEKKRLLSPPVETTGSAGYEIQKSPLLKKEAQEIQDGQAPINEAKYLPKSAKTGDVAPPVADMDNNVGGAQEGAHFQPRGAAKLEGETVQPEPDRREIQTAAVPVSAPASKRAYAPVQERVLQKTTRNPQLATRNSQPATRNSQLDHKSAEITRLVTRLQRSISREDNVQAEDLLGRLTALKGEENIYVMQLKAFLHIRNQDYESAAQLLEKVLERDDMNLEAGINMAVVEIKTNRIQDAKKRLAKLREIYSDNIFIPELLKKLK